MKEKTMNIIPEKEIEKRITSLQTKLGENNLPGCLIQDKINIFYYSGTMQNGALFIPESGDPVFFIRRSLEMGKQESPLKNLIQFKRFKDIPPVHCLRYDFSRLGY